MDELYNEVYGEYPNKAGEAYERLVAAAIKLLLNEDVSYDQRVRGDYSKTVYQLDGLINSNESKSMVEAKDYTLDDRKVGRGDIQKLQGALSDLPIDSGKFASATEFTSPAKLYAHSSKQNPLHKPIELFHIRPSTEEDEKGRLKTIVMNISSHNLGYANAKFKPEFTNEARTLLKANGYENKMVSFNIAEFYDVNGDTLISIAELTRDHAPTTTWEKGFVANGCWVVKGGYISVEGVAYGIEGLEYEVPFYVLEQKIVISSEGKAKLFVKSEDGSIDKLISDVDLRKVSFVDGKVVRTTH